MDKHSFPGQEEATEQTPFYGNCFLSFFSLYAVSSCSFSSVKHERKKNKKQKNISRKENYILLWLNIFLNFPCASAAYRCSRAATGAAEQLQVQQSSHRCSRAATPIGQEFPQWVFTMHSNFDRKLYI